MGQKKLKHSLLAKLWEKVAEEFNAVAMTLRRDTQVKKKWLNLGQAVSRKVSQINRERSKTGGGSASRLQLTAVEQRIADMIKSRKRRSTTHVNAGPRLSREDVVHQEETEVEAEVEAEHDQEAVSPDILHQHQDEDELDNEGQQEDLNNEMVTLELEPVNSLRTPSPLLSDTTDATFHGVQSEAAGPSGLQQATPEERPRRVGRRAQPEIQDAGDMG
uniref:uncharacterized protein n=1 Tax=Pristiophorus japonicus TaxID=55135 RepID=UPI00398E67CE